MTNMTNRDTTSNLAAPPPRGGRIDVHGGLVLMHRILTQQAENHQKLLELIQRKRKAIQVANIEEITELCRQEQTLAQRINELERKRLDLVEALTEQVEPAPGGPLAINELSMHAAEPLGQSLRDVATTLRTRIDSVRRESSIVNAAAQTLSRHITGIMQTVNRALSSVGVYERRGRIAVGSQLESCVDVKS